MDGGVGSDSDGGVEHERTAASATMATATMSSGVGVLGGNEGDGGGEPWLKTSVAEEHGC